MKSWHEGFSFSDLLATIEEKPLEDISHRGRLNLLLVVFSFKLGLGIFFYFVIFLVERGGNAFVQR